MKRRHTAAPSTYVGKPCASGHPSGVRYRRNNSCVECCKLAARLSRAHRSLGRAEFKDSPQYLDAVRALRTARGHIIEAAKCVESAKELAASNPIALHAPLRDLGLTPDLTFRIRKIALASFLDL